LSVRALTFRLVGLLVGFLSALATLAAIERFEPDETRGVVLGEPDFTAYCARDPEQPLEAMMSADTGWACVSGADTADGAQPLDPAEVCAWQYGVMATASPVDTSSPERWNCITNP